MITLQQEIHNWQLLSAELRETEAGLAFSGIAVSLYFLLVILIPWALFGGDLMIKLCNYGESLPAIIAPIKIIPELKAHIALLRYSIQTLEEPHK